MIWGRKGCNEDRRWKIKIGMISEDETAVSEQLSKKSAEKIFKEIRAKLEDSKKTINMSYINDYDREVNIVIPKTSITFVRLYRY